MLWLHTIEAGIALPISAAARVYLLRRFLIFFKSEGSPKQVLSNATQDV